jgi:hypothetical protein
MIFDFLFLFHLLYQISYFFLSSSVQFIITFVEKDILVETSSKATEVGTVYHVYRCLMYHSPIS